MKQAITCLGSAPVVSATSIYWATSKVAAEATTISVLAMYLSFLDAHSAPMTAAIGAMSVTTEAMKNCKNP